ncbi:hypothetical protein M0R04_15925 [Candidatus Dojkabacteria bacterium]|jgi:uncharacterized Zn finger protein (UPF0148 family)|nr:hypothetical protein [Candidatus Dojkabacteria bacterium]
MGPKGRVRDLDPKEVSLVDNPANKRRFLITKGGATMEVVDRILKLLGITDQESVDITKVIKDFFGESETALTEVANIIENKLNDDAKQKLVEALRILNSIDGLPSTATESIKILTSLLGYAPEYGNKVDKPNTDEPSPDSVSVTPSKDEVEGACADPNKDVMTKEGLTKIITEVLENQLQISKQEKEAELKKEVNKVMETKCTKCAMDISGIFKSVNSGSIFCPSCGTENMDPAVVGAPMYSALNKKIDTLSTAVEALTKALAAKEVKPEDSTMSELTKKLEVMLTKAAPERSLKKTATGEIEATPIEKAVDSLKGEKPGSLKRAKVAEKLIDEKLNKTKQ